VLAGRALDPSWDTLRLLCGVAAAVALAGAGLLALPARARRAALSLLVLFHFAAIASAIFSAAAPRESPSSLAAHLNARVFKPYLEFLYLETNYAFYSHGDKPAMHLWFYVTYADGEHRWVKVPGHDRGPVDQAHVRLLVLCWEVEPTESSQVTA